MAAVLGVGAGVGLRWGLGRGCWAFVCFFVEGAAGVPLAIDFDGEVILGHSGPEDAGVADGELDWFGQAAARDSEGDEGAAVWIVGVD